MGGRGLLPIAMRQVLPVVIANVFHIRYPFHVCLVPLMSAKRVHS